MELNDFRRRKNMELNDFIGMEKPWAYNFEFECLDDAYEKLETLMRYFIYKTQPEPPAMYLKETAEFIKDNFGYRPVYDPDGSNERAFYPIVIEIYKRLWSWNCLTESGKREGKYAKIDGNIFDNCFFGPDTMNSVQTALGRVVGAHSLYQTINRYYDPQKKDIDIKEKDIDIKEKDIDIKEKDIVQYIDWYHTLGNLVLVPEGFNEYRGKDEDIEDFWDLSLNHLKEKGYEESVKGHWDYNKRRHIYRDVVFDKCWFNKYINCFFLWDYVTHKDNDYIVRRISHKDCESGQSQLSPDFFVKTRDIIERRGQFMTAMLMLEQDNPVLYKDIQEWLVAKNDINKLPFFDGMNDAAGKILEKFGKKILEKAKGILKKLSS